GLTVRIAYTINGQTPGNEFDEIKNLTRMTPAGFGDSMLKFLGIGERITWAMNNNDNPNPTEKERYYQIAKYAAERGMELTMHWNNDKSVNQLLDLFESVNKDAPIGKLHWSIAHLNDASEQTLRRMKALGVGWTVQDAMYFDGDGLVSRSGEGAARR